LFKSGFGDPVNAAAFLAAELPGEVSALIAWESLRPEPGDFIDSQFRHSASDLLFSAKTAGSGAKTFIHVMLEHQREKDPWIALRLLRYMLRIWEAFVRDNPGVQKLPLVIPVVVAQTKEPWNLDPRFAVLADIPAGAEGLRAYVPDFGFHLIELAAKPYEDIRGTPAGILVLTVLKAEQIGDLLGDHLWDDRNFDGVSAEIVERVFLYMLTRGDVDKATFAHKVKTLHNAQTQATAMTLAEQYMQEGLQKGRQEEAQEAVIQALEARFDAVPDGLCEEIRFITDAVRLRALLRTAIRSADMESFAREI